MTLDHLEGEMARVCHADLIAWFTKLLPPRSEKEPLVWHKPLPPHRLYDPAACSSSDFVAAIEASEDVYALLRTPTRPVLFIHRPFQLDRRRIPHGTLVLASHFAFDERLTTGWNEHLALVLDLMPPFLCVRGHKGDPERRIGLVASPSPTLAISMQQMAQRLVIEFVGADAVEMHGDPGRPVRHLACLNAFTPELLGRLPATGPDVLCLTGQVRAEGMHEAAQRGMAVVAVGHLRCELWGVRWLAQQVALHFGMKWHLVGG